MFPFLVDTILIHSDLFIIRVSGLHSSLRLFCLDLLLLLFLGLLLDWCQCAELQGMNAPFLCHLVSQQSVHHSVSSRVHLGVKGIRGDDQSGIESVV